MRFAILLLLMLPLSLAANTTYRLDLFTETSCPGDMLHVDAIASNGQPAPDVELRLVLYEPFQGLRALKHTNSSGQTFFELTKNGTYRIYINTKDYNHDQYSVFKYPMLCPPPPPKQMVVDIEIGCDSRLMKISVSDGDALLEDVFVQSRHWSSMTGSSGTASLPLEDGDYFLMFEKHGYEPGAAVFGYPCPGQNPKCPDADSVCPANAPSWYSP